MQRQMRNTDDIFKKIFSTNLQRTGGHYERIQKLSLEQLFGAWAERT
jgi:hypothetical protein